MTVKAFRNFSQVATLRSAFKKDGRSLIPRDIDIIDNASIVFSPEEILWVGEDTDLPSSLKIDETRDFSGYTCTPGLVDCHTHLVFGGDRSKEYTMRLNGADYQEIANAGGGILNTVNGTNSSSKEELFEVAKQRVEQLYTYGVKTIEIKSGYGLNYDKEYELTLIIDDLKSHFKNKVQILNTYMAAHAVPKSFKNSSHYIDDVVIPLLEKLAPLKIIDAVDIFHETGYFSTADTEKLFNKSIDLKIPFKSHADEFIDNKGALLAANMGALSSDHLLCTTEDGIRQLASTNTVATLLPGTGYFLGKPQANARGFLDAGARVAIGSDYNPGSCHWDNVLQIAALAAPQYKMNIAELWASITLNASYALRLHKQGAIHEGLLPIFSIFKVDTIDRITYNWGRNFNENSF